MFLIVAILIGILICALLIPKIIKLFDVDEYEIDFEERTKGQFIGRFDLDYFDFKNHDD